MCEWCQCNCKCASIAFISLWSIAALLTIVLVAISFSTLEINQAGLKLDTINYVLETNSIYLTGRHWIGLGNEFKKFPLDHQRIEFTIPGFGSIFTKTADLFQISVQISVTYKLRQELLQELFNKFPNMEYESVFANIIKHVIINTSQKFILDDFFKKRSSVSDEMSNSVNIQLRNVYAQLEFFELKEITLETSLEQSIINQIVTKNEALIQLANSKIKNVQGDIEVLKASSESNVTQTILPTQMNSEINVSIADSESINDLINAHSKLLKPFVTDLNFNNDEINKLLYYIHLDEESFFSNLTIFFYGLDDYTDSIFNK